MIRTNQLLQLRTQPIRLVIVQNPNSGQVTVFLKKLDLLFRKPIPFPILRGRRRKQPADRFGILCQIADHPVSSFLQKDGFDRSGLPMPAAAKGYSSCADGSRGQRRKVLRLVPRR